MGSPIQKDDGPETRVPSLLPRERERERRGVESSCSARRIAGVCPQENAQYLADRVEARDGFVLVARPMYNNVCW